MPYNDRNIYDCPGKHKLSTVAVIDWSNGHYRFDLRVVWKHRDGRFFTARDSGCSCPAPFERYGSIKELDRLDVSELEAEARRERRASSDIRTPRTALEVRTFLDTVRAAVATQASPSA